MAQATRTWVSGVGDDANPCSRTAPCKTFAGAISKTAAAGSIDCLDPGGFGGVTITFSITIRCVGVEGGVLVSGTNGITVAAGPTDVVNLEGLDIDGVKTGLNGVNVLSGRSVTISNCVISQFTGSGVSVTSTSVGTRVNVLNSHIFNNGTAGVAVQGNGVANGAFVEGSTIEDNAYSGIAVGGAGNLVVVARSAIIAISGGSAILLASGGQAYSFGPTNVVAGSGAFSAAPLPLQ